MSRDHREVPQAIRAELQAESLNADRRLKKELEEQKHKLSSEGEALGGKGRARKYC